MSTKVVPDYVVSLATYHAVVGIYMEQDELRKLLVNKAITIVHFSCHAIMGHKIPFPDDLKYAISNYKVENRSCCALFPGHSMDLPGSVGVIFDPVRIEEIISVSSCDSGSSDHGGEENSFGVDPTAESIIESLNHTISGYNEWRVCNAIPYGIFIANSDCIMAKQKRTLKCGDQEFPEVICEEISLSEVKTAFPDLSIYTLGKDCLECIS